MRVKLVSWVSGIPKMGLVLAPFIYFGNGPHLGVLPYTRKHPTERFQNFIKSQDCWDELYIGEGSCQSSFHVFEVPRHEMIGPSDGHQKQKQGKPEDPSPT
jgi:hypothetical protein